MKLLLWLNMLVALMATMPLAWMGMTYQTAGQGLHPAIAVGGVLVCLGLGWASASLADSEFDQE